MDSADAVLKGPDVVHSRKLSRSCRNGFRKPADRISARCQLPAKKERSSRTGLANWREQDASAQLNCNSTVALVRIAAKPKAAEIIILLSRTNTDNAGATNPLSTDHS